MYKNILYDLIVIGASLDGIETVKKITKEASTIKVAFISKNFNKLTEKLNADLVKAKIIYSEYNHGIIGLTLDNNSKIFSQNVIIATGTTPIKLKIKDEIVPVAKYRLDDFKKISKNNQIAIFGNSKEAVNAAITLSKKIKYVYLCSPTIKLNCTDVLKTKLISTKNIAYLNNCELEDYTLNNSNELISITLKPYETIHCTGILSLIGAEIDPSGLAPYLVNLNTDNKIIINENCVTTKVPHIYAVGECAAKYSKAAGNRLIDQIIKDNNWR